VPYILARDPLCQLGIICGGRAPSSNVDHIIRAEIYIDDEHAGDETFFYDPDNLRGLCQACHSHKTALENRGLWKEPDQPIDPDADYQRG
jgi:5-methylcytosine-specific restriction endonuclease McrA